jgi:hypothetical protein
MNRLIRRFKREFWLSVAASALALFLAVVGRGRYDPTLAVLTATLVVLVWYTFFTYCAVHRDEPTTILVEVRKAALRRIEVMVRNASSGRRVRVRLRIAGQRNGQAMPMPPGVDGSRKHELLLLPSEIRTEVIAIDPAQPRAGSKFGPKVALGEPEQAIVCVSVAWWDDLGESDVLAPDYWAVDIRHVDVRRYQRISSAEDEWRKLGGVKIDPIVP